MAEYTVAANQPYIIVPYYGRVWYNTVLYYRSYLYKLFTKSDVIDKILKNMVIGFGDYTPPLHASFIAAYPTQSL